MHCFLDVCVGAANGVPGRATKATLRIQGGSFLGRTLLVGIGWGAESQMAIEGSRPSAVHVLDYANIEAHTDVDGTPGNTTLEYTLDEQGVTPITIQARYRGLQIIKDAQSHCRLRIKLSAIPRATTSRLFRRTFPSKECLTSCRKEAKSLPITTGEPIAGY